MDTFIAENFFSIIATIAAFGITYILKNINDGLKTLQQDYKMLLTNKDENKLETQKAIAEIRELIAGKYVSKAELPTLVHAVIKEGTINEN